MKAKYVLLAVLLATLLVTPAFGFWHPPEVEPPCPYFAVMINGEFGTSANPYIFEEPEDNFCDSVTVEVYIAKVADLYGYEFNITWDPTYFSLVDFTVEEVWPTQFIVKAEQIAPYAYSQVVVAQAPSTGVSGDFKLATLVFHIVNDVCWMQPYVDGWFWLDGLKASDSCGVRIDLCGTIQGYWRFKPVKPKVYMDPAEEINWIVGDKFTVTIWAENVVKLKDVRVIVKWEGKELPAEPGVWTVLLCTKETDIVINEDVFPTDKRTSWSLVVDSPSCTKTYDSNPNGTVDLYIEMDCEFPLINGTFWIMKITFTKCDPWFCGRQPLYERIDHEWTLETGETDIWFHDGYFSVYCPDYTYMLFGTHVDIVGAHYTFKPIPGDLDGSGHVDIVDLCIIAGYYGKGNSYYDLNRDGIIDVFDIVVVAKNFCRTKP